MKAVMTKQETREHLKKLDELDEKMWTVKRKFFGLASRRHRKHSEYRGIACSSG